MNKAGKFSGFNSSQLSGMVWRNMRDHYLKWTLDKDGMSVRYYFITPNKNMHDLKYKFILKNHHTKEKRIISKSEAIVFIKNRGISFEEVVSHKNFRTKSYIRYYINGTYIRQSKEGFRDTIMYNEKMIIDPMSKSLIGRLMYAFKLVIGRAY